MALMSSPRATFEISTRLGAPAADVWDFAVSPDGINYELSPLVAMTMPEGIVVDMTIDDAPVGESLGRSWIKLAGILPVDFDDLCLAERGPGLRFVERSRLGSASFWQHERQVLATADEECKITDRLEIEVRTPLRLVGGGQVAPLIVRALFTHRHNRLAARWGRV